MKKLSIVALVLVLAMVFTGCHIDEIRLNDAFKKTQDITSLESEMNLRFTIEAEGLPEEQQQKFQEISEVLNLASLNIKQKMLQNEEKDAVKAMADIEFDAAELGMNIDTSVWIEAVFSEEDFKLVEIIKIPDIAKLLLSLNGLPSKDYILYDIKDIMSEIQGDISGFSNYYKNVNSKVKTLQESFLKSFNPGFTAVKYKGQKLYYNEKQNIYEVRLDDAKFKKLLGNFVNYSLDNEEVLEFLEEYFEFIMNIATSNINENQPEQEEKLESLVNVDELLPELKEKFSAFMDIYKDEKIIGDEGIVIEYTVNEDGYIVREKGNFDFIIDLKTLGKAFGAEEFEVEELEGVFKFNIEFDSRSFNINEEIEIEMPEVDGDNSFNVLDLLLLNSVVESEI